MSYCANYDSLNLPTIPVGEGCLKENSDGSISVYRSDKTFEEIRKENLKIIEQKFDELRSGVVDTFTKHKDINCLIGYMLDHMQKNNETQISNTDNLNELKVQLNRERKFLQDQENVLKTNQNSDMVAKYRQETSDSRNNELNKHFVIYTTMIVVFLIIEGIVFLR